MGAPTPEEGRLGRVSGAGTWKQNMLTYIISLSWDTQDHDKLWKKEKAE